MPEIRSSRLVDPYKWGDGGTGWPLVRCDTFEIKEEELAPGCGETLHAHARTSQCYYILEGRAEVVVDGETSTLVPGECVLIPAGSPHTVANNSDAALRLLVASAPPVGGDRVELAPRTRDG